MLVDYLEEAAEQLKEKKEAFRNLNRQYKLFYSRDIREEMKLLKAEINKKNHEVNEQLYENLRELLLLKKYFPDLYEVLKDDESIGRLIKKKDWLLDRKEEKKMKAEEKLNEIRDKRVQLRDARKFLKKWPRPTIDAKSLIATWPILKGAIKGELDKEDVIAAIKDKNKELKRAGWLILINESMVELPLSIFLGKIKSLRSEEEEKKAKMKEAEGKGSVKEYESLKEFKEAQKTRIKAERKCRHLLLASQGFLEKIKKNRKWKKPTDLEKLVSQITIQKINEKEWLRDMRKRLE